MSIDAINELYQQIIQVDTHLIARWKHLAAHNIKRFAKNVASASSFIDSPKKLFGLRVSKKEPILTMRGASPNLGRTRDFRAPIGEYEEVDRSFPIFGSMGWKTLKQTQKVSKSAGAPIQDVNYYGTNQSPLQFFGVRRGSHVLAFGRTIDGLALPVYAEKSLPDMIFERHSEELERIILESGREVLDNYLRGVK